MFLIAILLFAASLIFTKFQGNAVTIAAAVLIVADAIEDVRLAIFSAAERVRMAVKQSDHKE